MPARSRSYLAVAACVLLPLGLAATFAADGPSTEGAAPQPAEDRPAPLITRLYDIRDLLISPPAFSDSPDFMIAIDPPSPPEDTPPKERLTGIAHSRMKEQSLKTYEEMVEDRVKVLTEAVAPETWQETGGAPGSIRERDGRLIITHTAENHRAIQELLDRERELMPRPVRIRAHWVLMQRRDLEPMLKPAAGGDGRPGRGATLEADPRALENLGDGTTHFRGEVVCVNHQRVYVTSVRAGPYVKGDPSNPRWDAMATGLTLNVTNTISADRKTAFLTVQSQVMNSDAPDGEVERPQAIPPEPTTRPAKAKRLPQGIQGTQGAHSRVSLQELSTFVSVPVGPTVLIGGMTLDPTHGGPDAPQLYLFLQVTAD